VEKRPNGRFKARVYERGTAKSLGDFETATEAAVCFARYMKGERVRSTCEARQPQPSLQGGGVYRRGGEPHQASGPASSEVGSGVRDDSGDTPTHANGLALHLARGTATGYRGVEMKRDKRGLPTGRYKARVWEAGAARTLGEFGSVLGAAECYARHLSLRAYEAQAQAAPGAATDGCRVRLQLSLRSIAGAASSVAGSAAGGSTEAGEAASSQAWGVVAGLVVVAPRRPSAARVGPAPPTAASSSLTALSAAAAAAAAADPGARRSTRERKVPKLGGVARHGGEGGGWPCPSCGRGFGCLRALAAHHGRCLARTRRHVEAPEMELCGMAAGGDAYLVWRERAAKRARLGRDCEVSSSRSRSSSRLG
jgi:hypothetical protein